VTATFEGLFARQAASHPETLAACDSTGGRLTYGELEHRSNGLAAGLAAAGIGPESLVALALARGVAFLVAVLGVFKAGGAYLPLDLGQPPARLRQMLSASRPRLCLIDSGRTLVDLAMPCVSVSADPAEPIFGDLPASSLAATPSSCLAYVIYTSGSSGGPKGAMVERRGMLNHLLAKVGDLGLGPDDVVAQTAAAAFDISVWQMLAPLLAGGSTAIFGDEVVRDPRRLAAACDRAGVSVLELVPAQLRALLDSGVLPAAEGRLRLLLATGEDLPPELCRRWLASRPHVSIVNAYGPTECSDDVTHGWVREPPPESAVRVPIGCPLANLRVDLLDGDLGLDAGGELCVAGAGVGRGYLGDPARTAVAFVPDPLGDTAGSRLYRTGDLARRREDGQLEYLGRLDDQAKVRGFRIETAEVRKAAEEHPAVAEAAVFVREVGPGDRRLAACVAPRPGLKLSSGTLRAFLAERLPAALLPSTIAVLPALPRNANGKLDRAALTSALATTSCGRSGTPPRGEAELALAAIWCGLLGVDRVGAEEGFFEIGGDSLLAARLQAAIAVRFGREVDLLELYRYPTIRAFGARLSAAAFPSPAAARHGARPPERGARRLQARREVAGRADKNFTRG
jgi:amino acid adenylation domain-containing protein